MTVYRLRIECVCEVPRKGERCAKFFKSNFQGWAAHLGKLGNGFFTSH